MPKNAYIKGLKQQTAQISEKTLKTLLISHNNKGTFFDNRLIQEIHDPEKRHQLV